VILELLQFFFQDGWHWIGGLVYIAAVLGAFGMGLGLIVELIRGK